MDDLPNPRGRVQHNQPPIDMPSEAVSRISRQAKHNPVKTTQPVYDSRDHQLPQESVKVMAGEIVLPPEIDIAGEQFTMDDVDAAAFMEQLVLITMNPKGSQSELDIETVTVNGIPQPIWRGRHQWVKRKYVEALIHAIQETFTQEQDPYELDKSHFNKMPSHSYPFQVIQDSERGRAWLRHMMQLPA